MLPETPPVDNVYAITKVYGRGRTQIPDEVRNQLGLRDGDKVIWYADGSRICIKKKMILYSFTTKTE
jgi:AbrB family looped-hinge helix DNA binding protein